MGNDVNSVLLVLNVILASLLSLSEILALIPSVKSNSIFQMVVNILRALKSKS